VANGLENALEALRAATRRGDVEAVCRASRVVYVLGLDAARCDAEQWEGIAASVIAAFDQALKCMVPERDGRMYVNVCDRYEELLSHAPSTEVPA